MSCFNKGKKSDAELQAERTQLENSLPLASKCSNKFENNPPEEISLTISQTIRTQDGKSGPHYHYYDIKFGCSGRNAVVHGISEIISQVQIVGPSPVEAFYDTKPKPLSEFRLHQTERHPLEISIQWGHELDLRGVFRLKDGSVVPFVHHISKSAIEDDGDYFAPVPISNDSTIIKTSVKNLPEKKIADYIFPGIAHFKMDQRNLEILEFQYNGKKIPFSYKKSESESEITIEVQKITQRDNTVSNIMYDGLLYIDGLVLEPEISESLGGHVLRYLKGWPLQNWHNFMRKLLKGTPTKCLLLPANKNFAQDMYRDRNYSYRYYYEKEEIPEEENDSDDEIDDDFGESNISKSLRIARKMLEENLKIHPEDARKIIEEILRVIQAHNSITNWIGPSEHVQIPTSTRKSRPTIDILHNLIPANVELRLGNLIPENLRDNPELLYVWKSVKFLLWQWENISQGNWQFRLNQQLRLRDQKRRFYNPEKFYFLMVIHRIFPNFPQEILPIVFSFLPPLFFGGLIFTREKRKYFKCAGDIYEKTVLKFDPISMGYFFVEEIDNSNSNIHTFVAHLGSYSMENSSISFSAEKYLGFVKQHHKDNEWTYVEMDSIKLKEKLSEVNDKSDKNKNKNNFIMKNDFRNGGLKIVSTRYTLNECTEADTKLVHSDLLQRMKIPTTLKITQ